jgi:hypothetical protein
MIKASRANSIDRRQIFINQRALDRRAIREQHQIACRVGCQFKQRTKRLAGFAIANSLYKR